MTEAIEAADPLTLYTWAQKAKEERKAECPPPPTNCPAPMLVPDCAKGSTLYHRPHTTRLVYMKPRTFLCAAQRLRKDVTYKITDSIPYLINQMSACLPLDLPFLDVDVKTGQVLSHEGRHRALAAEMLGIERIPVALFHLQKFRGKDYHEPVDPDPVWQEAILSPKERFKPFVKHQRLVRRLKSEYDIKAGKKPLICVD